MKQLLKDYFSFSKKETLAAIILLVLIGGFIVLPYVYKTNNSKPVIDKNLQAQIAKLQQATTATDSTVDEGFTHSFQPSNTVIETKFTLFEFDPNTLDAAGWKRLGLRDKTITTIFNYRNKGGKFRRPEDISKIWGLRSIEAERIIPYARINLPQSNYAKSTFTNYEPSKKAISIIDINTASVNDMRNIPGMENGLQYRIAKFREKLGGFNSLEQVKETYGMSDSAFEAMQPYIKFLPTAIIKLNINTASDIELNAHPYITKPVAKAIALYRTQHGNYQSVADIKKIAFIKEEVFQKMAPYLTVE